MKHKAKKKRKGMKKLLPNTLTKEQWAGVLGEFHNTCALKENGKQITKEHFIPLSTGHGGTTIENIYPMEANLNVDKSGKNPFKWVKSQPQHIQHNFRHKLVPYLAEINGMGVKEFEDYTNWCFEHPRTQKQVAIDNEIGLTSKDLFYASVAITHSLSETA